MKIILLLLLLSGLIFAGEPDWPYADGYDDNMLFLHALINYDYSAQWYYDWEKQQFDENSFRITVGSVTTSDLMTEANLRINHDIGAGWRFQARGRRYETRHESRFDNYAFMGLEKQISGGFNLHLLVNPGYFKEETDLQMGVAFYSDSRTSYLNLSLLIEDFVYDAKNDLSGVTTRTPRGLGWAARMEKLPFVIYTQGRISNGYERIYTDMDKSGDMTLHSLQNQEAGIKIYYFPADGSLLSAEVRFKQFAEDRHFFSGLYDYSYENISGEISLHYITGVFEKDRIRTVGRYIQQRADGDGFKGHRYDRSEFLIGLFYEYALGTHAIEAGYMFSAYDLAYKGLSQRPDFADNGFVDKVKLGWMYNFPDRARINISISHQLILGGFGGANLQYIMFF